MVALILVAMVQTLAAQPETFPNENQLPTGWSLVNYGNAPNLWNVDGTPTHSPPLGSNVSITPFRSGPYSLNFNNSSGQATSSTQPYAAGGVQMPVVDLSFSSLSARPRLQFQTMWDQWNAQCNQGHLKEIRIWNPTRTIRLQTFTLCGRGDPQDPRPTIRDWFQPSYLLEPEWGRVIIEFYYGAQSIDHYIAGWFIDDVNIDRLSQTGFGITNAVDLGTVTGGQPYSLQINTQNGTLPITYSIAEGALPSGLSLNANTGLISGTPGIAGVYNFTVEAVDSSTPNPQTARRIFFMEVTRPTNFQFPVMSLPFVDDFSLDFGWVYSESNVPYGPSPGNYNVTSSGGWERGFATQSPQGSWQFDTRDPAQDRSPGTDNMLMGVAVGGTWPTVTANTWYWAYTPEITVSGVRELELEFYRWISQDPNHVNAQVEIYNPGTSSWDNIWSLTGSNEGRDSSWKKEAVSIDFGQSAPANSTTRLRFGWRASPTAISGNYRSGGWNLDDVSLTANPQANVVNFVQFHPISTSTVGSTVEVFVGQKHHMRLDVNNTLSNQVAIYSLTYSFEMPRGTPANIGNMVMANPPSVQNPWILQPGMNVVSDGLGGGTYPIELDVTALHPNGNGTTVAMQAQMMGVEVGGSLATISDLETNLPGGAPLITVSLLPPFQFSSPINLPDAGHNHPYSFTFSANYGEQPYHSWTLVHGPAWLSQDPANPRTILGTPSGYTGLPALEDITFSVSDSASPNVTITEVFQLTIDAGGSGPLRIESPTDLPDARQFRQYSDYTLNAAGGDPPYTWHDFDWLSAPYGNGPIAGMSFEYSSGTLMGYPTSPVGQYRFQVSLTDAQQDTVIYEFSIAVIPETSSVTITTPSSPTASGAPPFGLETAAYNDGTPFQFEAVGGFQMAPAPYEYHWVITAGNLPPGLSLDPYTGQLSGSPTQFGTYRFTVRASDGAFPPATASTEFLIHIEPLVPAPMAIVTPKILPRGAEMNTYYLEFEQLYGITPLTWRVQTGSQLPIGLGLEPQTGILEGAIFNGQVPLPSGEVSFTIEVTDSSFPPQTTEKTFTMEIDAFEPGPLRVVTTQLREAGVEMPYRYGLRASGGNPLDPANAYMWMLPSDSKIPRGLSLEPNGEVVGVPFITQAGTHVFRVRVSDQNGSTVEEDVSITINPWAGGTETEVEIIPGDTHDRTVPFWEACSVGIGHGTGILALAALVMLAMIRRRRLA
jgi:MYXO-CTERM domain-containing protein